MIDFFLNNIWTLWMAIALVFLIIEVLTTGLISIWFVPGAIVTAVLSVWIKNFFIQLVIFLVISVITMFICRNFFKYDKGEKLAESNQLLIGKTGVANTNITPLDGQVLIGDVYWRATSNCEISQGESIKIINIQGNTLIVERI